MTVLSLCDRTGAWSQPYADAGYNVVRIDLHGGQDVWLLKFCGPLRGVLAAPPCTNLARVGARWWKTWGDAKLLEALAVVDACCRIVLAHQPCWWAIENPVGRLSDYLGPPQLRFHPSDYGDSWTKRTWLWGKFNPPTMRKVPVKTVNWVETINGRGRADRRSVTPAGFARAFFEANP